ncbi:MAG: Na/Pi cotransporter family protein [Planctomycetota bacterium]|jgi:phosphate:Na+ symporter
MIPPIAATDSIELVALASGLFGGLAIFLYGLEHMTDSLRTVAGRGMKNLLARLMTNRFKAVLAGGFITAVIQSSSVTTVLAVGFVSAGLMTLEQSIGIIMGASIGTTITAQIIAFKVTKYALIMVAGGFALRFFSKRETVKHYGTMLLGFGLIFFGMSLMKSTMKPLQSYQPFIDTMQHLQSPLLAILFGALFTALVQSSSATTGVILVIAGEGLISLETGIALALGANIGTCITALLAAIGRPAAAVQTAMVHVCFNTFGVLLWFGFIDQLAEWVRYVSPAHPEITDGTARLAAEAPRQIANAHTTFNVANTLIFIWFTTPLAALVRRMVPDRPEAVPSVMEPKYLDDNLIRTPELALDRVRLELGRTGGRALEMVREALPAAAAGTREGLAELAKMDDDVDALHGAIVSYLGRISARKIESEQSERLADYMADANHIEAIGDMIETNIVQTGMERVVAGVKMSPATVAVLGRLHERVCWSVERALEALRNGDPGIAAEVVAAKSEISALADQADKHLGQRLTAAEDDRVVLFRLESEIIEYLKRVYYFAKRIAKSVRQGEPEFMQEEPSSGP